MYLEADFCVPRHKNTSHCERRTLSSVRANANTKYGALDNSKKVEMSIKGYILRPQDLKIEVRVAKEQIAASEMRSGGPLRVASTQTRVMKRD